jgi:hypothetical protein
MLDWKANLETFIEQTTAFTNSVRIGSMPRTVVEPNHLPPVNWTGSEREEISRRVASFRAHQERFMRDREDYAASEFKRMLASRK